MTVHKQWLYHIDYAVVVVTNRILSPTDYYGEWVSIGYNDVTHEHAITVRDGYSWDGCSPKFVVGQLLFGVPDGVPIAPGKPITWRASLVHDALYQEHAGHGVNKGIVDTIFYDELMLAGFRLARSYYNAVRYFGHAAWKKHEASTPVSPSQWRRPYLY